MTYLDSQAFGQAIRAARKAQGLHQDQLTGCTDTSSASKTSLFGHEQERAEKHAAA